MKFLIVDCEYPEFLKRLYIEHPELKDASYKEQVQAHVDSYYNITDSYADNLRKLGHEAYAIHINNEFAQRAWIEEHNFKIDDNSLLDRTYANMLKFGANKADSISRMSLRFITPSVNYVTNYISRHYQATVHPEQEWFYKIFKMQVEYYKPDMLINLNLNFIDSKFLKEIKNSGKFVIGQHAATELDKNKDFSCYNLILSSFPPTIDFFKERGINARMFRLGFEPKVLDKINSSGVKPDISFVGSFFDVHTSRTKVLESICRYFPQTMVWGNWLKGVSHNSPIRKCYQGEAWGRDMFQILHNSKITFNHHGNVPPYANNMRLYEATGVGTLLVTDWKENLKDMFEPASEVVTYRSESECIKKIEYYLEHDKERIEIAKAGQARTLREHTYFQRMEELIDIIGEYI